jgi:hypothetical protein
MFGVGAALLDAQPPARHAMTLEKVRAAITGTK